MMARVVRRSISVAFMVSERSWAPAALPSSFSSSSPYGCSWCFGSKTDRHLRFYSAVAAAEEVAGGLRGMTLHGGLRSGWDLLGAKEYLEYRRSLYGEITHKALLVDAVGTLVVPSQPMAQIYRQFGEKYGVQFSEDEILKRYRWAYEQPWGRSRLRYVDDGRPFWQFIAWHLCDPDAEKVFEAVREAGVKVAVVSNFDTRLRPLLRALKCDHWFDAVAVSAEVAAEKPNPTIFIRACELLGVKPEDAVHVGDDRRNDIWGARDAGCDAWLWGSDVHSFKEVAERIGVRL
ncbi:hypothetical protein IEQ34_016233 [Dendrobium chrysotoxum]|uniref:Uncharacterized protein n=1 Tax=Dendrobium chrysotoxum TaxID=161865 RepID=A0AAV7GF64_DENCH|nr:hypothetical protein IEQ34_016233 [Dendrobium chrysotoxum]